MESGMVKEQLHTLMGASMLGNGKTGHIMVKEHSLGPMDATMQENTRRGKHMDKVLLLFLMVEST